MKYLCLLVLLIFCISCSNNDNNFKEYDMMLMGCKIGLRYAISEIDTNIKLTEIEEENLIKQGLGFCTLKYIDKKKAEKKSSFKISDGICWETGVCK